MADIYNGDTIRRERDTLKAENERLQRALTEIDANQKEPLTIQEQDDLIEEAFYRAAQRGIQQGQSFKCLPIEQFEQMKHEAAEYKRLLKEVYDGLLWLDILFNTTGTVLAKHRELIASIAEALGLLTTDSEGAGDE